MNEFHNDLYEHLLDRPKPGGRLDRETPLTLGVFDVGNDGITLALRVTADSTPKYGGRSGQCAAVDGVRLSIVCVLDPGPEAAQPLVSAIIVNRNVPTLRAPSKRRNALPSCTQRQ